MYQYATQFKRLKYKKAVDLAIVFLSESKILEILIIT